MFLLEFAALCQGMTGFFLKLKKADSEGKMEDIMKVKPPSIEWHLSRKAEEFDIMTVVLSNLLLYKSRYAESVNDCKGLKQCCPTVLTLGPHKKVIMNLRATPVI